MIMSHYKEGFGYLVYAGALYTLLLQLYILKIMFFYTSSVIGSKAIF